MNNIIAVAVIIVAVLGAIFAAVRFGRDSGKAAAEIKTREKVDEEVAKADAARAAVRPDDAASMRSDPYNRDNRV